MNSPLSESAIHRSWADRLLNRRAGGMLLRNTAVSCGTFLIGLAVMWALVDQAEMYEVPASGISFVLANTLHYALGRAWIFKGTDRSVATGYAMFIFNGMLGLLLTMSLMAAFVEWTTIHYLVARVLVSAVAGLLIFVLNAVFTFRRL